MSTLKYFKKFRKFQIFHFIFDFWWIDSSTIEVGPTVRLSVLATMHSAATPFVLSYWGRLSD